jgi:hypothetical protein
MVASLKELESHISGLSHSHEAVDAIVSFCASLKGTRGRMELWNSVNAIVRSPIDPQVVCQLGFDKEDDKFTLLQGDIVRTDCAFYFGERIMGNPKYAVLNSSCDLVPGRAYSSILLKIVPLLDDDKDIKQKLGQLLKFSRRDAMYIPPLPDDPISVVGNVINFDGACQIRTEDLFLSTRIASLSLVGWRIFGAFSRTAIIRANPRETAMRQEADSAAQAATA